MTNDPHILVSDDSGHMYLIPEDLEKEFYEWDEAMAQDGVTKHNFMPNIVNIRKLRILQWTEQ